VPWSHKAITSTIEPGAEGRRRVFAWVPLQKVVENAVAVAEAQGDLATALDCIPVVFCADATSLWRTAADILLPRLRWHGVGVEVEWRGASE
jgi:hypothetical protein